MTDTTVFALTIIVNFVTGKEKENKMRVKNFSFTFREFEKPEELDPDDLKLISSAGSSAGRAYAPYSKFRVGAAVRLESGRIVTGANVENSAFPSGICAERTAISFCVSNFPDDHPVAMAITAINDAGITAGNVSPCGNCRQVIAEEEKRTGKPIRIILSGRDTVRIIDSCGDLLPLRFSLENLTADHL